MTGLKGRIAMNNFGFVLFKDDAFARPRGGSGPREKFGRARGRGRFPRGRDEKQVQKEDEEAKQIAVSIL